MVYNGKAVLSSDNFSYSGVRIGDYVEQAVVDDAIDCVPTACMGPNCSQMGEPASQRVDPDTGEWRLTYHTFKRVAGAGTNGVWQYCGRCFGGENVEHGDSIPFDRGDGIDD